MNENQTPQINNGSEKKEQSIPSWVGIVLIILLVGTFIFFFWKFQETSNSVKQAVETQKATSDEPPQIVSQENPQVGNTAPSAAVSETAPAPAIQISGSTVDISYEIKKLDESNNSIDEDDFDSNNYSDAQIGL
jgi:hypothetical protein